MQCHIFLQSYANVYIYVGCIVMTLSSHMGNNYPWHKEETHFYDDDNHYLKIGSGGHSALKV